MCYCGKEPGVDGSCGEWCEDPYKEDEFIDQYLPSAYESKTIYIGPDVKPVDDDMGDRQYKDSSGPFTSDPRTYN